jgi:hypothetical protein
MDMGVKKIYTQQSHPELATSINLAWAKLYGYYKKLDDSPAVRVCDPVRPPGLNSSVKSQQ